MLKYFIFTIFTLLLTACGENNSHSPQNTVTTPSKYLTVQHAPLNTSSLVARNERITLTFSAALDTNSINNSSVYLENNASEPIGTLVESSTSDTITITPYSYLKASTLYTVVVTTDVRDTQGRSLQEDYRYSFTTLADTVQHLSPILRSRKPDINETSVAKLTSIAIDFTVPLSLEPEYSTSSYIKLSDSNGTVYDGKVEVFNSILKFTPTTPLPASTTMRVELNQSVQDMYGNVVPTVAPWSFTTSYADALIPNEGYGVLRTLETNKTASLVKNIESNASRSIVAVAHANTVTLYAVNYTALPTKPTLSTLGSLTLGSQITALESYNPVVNDPLTYLVVGTLSNGLYILKEENGTLTELENYPLSEAVYNVAVGTNLDMMIDKIYAVGPQLGVKIFTPNATTPILAPFKDVNKSIVGTALDLVDNIDQNNNNLRNLYIADYDGRVVFLDENGTYKRALDFNGSVKKILVEKDPSNIVQPRFFSITSLGKAQAFWSDGSIGSNVKMDLLDGLSDATIYVESGQSTSSFYGFYSDGSKNVTIAQGDAKQGLIQMSDNIISTVVVNSSINPFLLTLSQSGKLSIVNAMQEYEGPYASTSPYDGETGIAADANITISFDSYGASYLDTATISAASFTFVDVNQSSGPIFTFSSQVSYDPQQASTRITYIIDPAANLKSGDTYRVTISKDISSMLGTQFNNGVDQNISFTIQ